MRPFLRRLWHGHYRLCQPGAGENIQQLFAFIAIAKNGKVILSKKITAANNGQHMVQLYLKEQAIKLLIAALKKK